MSNTSAINGVGGYQYLPAQSPDQVPLVDLSIYDLDAAGIYAQALANVQTQFPDWTPLTGNTEVVILQAMALAASELGYAINRLPLAILMALAALFNISPIQGIAPMAMAIITLTDTLGHLIPQGTQFSYTPSNGSPVNFQTTFNLSIPVGSNSGSVLLQATVATAVLNGLANSTPLTILTTGGVSIQSVVLGSAVSGGVNPETTQAWLTRAAGVLQSTTNTVVTANQFQQFAVDTTGIWRANMIDNFEPTYYSQWGASTGASMLGEITLGVYGQGQVPATSAVKSGLLSTLQTNAVANLGINIIDANVTAINASVSAVGLSGYSPATVASNIQNALGAWLDTDSWTWGRHARVMDAYKITTNAPGVDYVTNVTFTTSTAGASVIPGTMGQLIAASNYMPTSPDMTSFEDGTTGDWSASCGYTLFWPYNQPSFETAASVGNSTAWAAVGTHSLEITGISSTAASSTPSLWIENTSLSVASLPNKNYTISAVVNYGAAGSVLAAANANQLVWLISDSVGNAYQALVSMAFPTGASSGIATFLATFKTAPVVGNFNSMILFLLAGYPSAIGYPSLSQIYVDNIGLWLGLPAGANATGVSGVPVYNSGFTYTSEPNIMVPFVGGDVLLGGIPSLGLATLGNCFVQVATGTGVQA